MKLLVVMLSQDETDSPRQICGFRKFPITLSENKSALEERGRCMPQPIVALNGGGKKSQNVAAARAAAATVSLRVRECWKRSHNVSMAFSPLS